MSDDKTPAKKTVTVLLIGPSYNGGHDEAREVTPAQAASLVENGLARLA